MNTPTTCMKCGKVDAIDKMCRDIEGNWFCKECRKHDLDLIVSGLMAAHADKKEKPK